MTAAQASLPAVVLLDCDGVLFPFAPEEVSPAAWPDLTQVVVGLDGHAMTASPRLLKAVRSLMERPGVRFVFMTSWYSATEDFPETLGFPATPYLVPTEERGWWKFHHVRELAKTSEVLWIDDDIKDDTEVLEWLAASERVTHISPSIHHGLNPQELALMRTWVAAHEAKAAP